MNKGREGSPKREPRLVIGHKSNRKIIDAQMAFFGTGCIINEQVILQDQEGYKLLAA
jgi:hypothetical protein